MPLIHIHIAEGKSLEKRRELLDNITETVRETLQADVKSIRIFLHEFSKDNYKGSDF
jgi:4-oxalocrotonate tautomerase